MKTWIEPIKKLRACQTALEWAEKYNSLEEAWAQCERGDWMLWLAGRLSGTADSPERKRLVFTACQCARLALPHVTKGENRPRIAIETAEAWTRGEATIKQVIVAAYAASDAASHAEARVAAQASHGAAHAAYAASTASHAASAAYAAQAASHAASQAQTATLKQCVDIVRQYYPVSPEEVLVQPDSA